MELEINDNKIIECILKTNDWISLCRFIKENTVIKQYSLWIGKIKWGDNEQEDIIAYYKDGKYCFKSYMTSKHSRETSFDLVSMIIHAWEAEEKIELDLNNSIINTFSTLIKNNPDLEDEINDIRWTTPYQFHDGIVR